MLHETMSRSEQIGEEYELALKALETVYDCIYSLREAGAKPILDDLSGQLHVLVQMPQSTYTLDGYDPRFLATWEVVAKAMTALPQELQQEPRLQAACQTGDIIRARVTRGKKTGTYVGRVAIKTDGYFKITGTFGMVEGIHARYCSSIHRNDGYAYQKGQAARRPLRFTHGEEAPPFGEGRNRQ